ncbi:hypothetical protein FS749_000690 [Ceratobasidium sp. UAMH 11750]|nr:hypothetical protein FS749_000690 [Ceratobasidium sp. UAMH 11750]
MLPDILRMKQTTTAEPYVEDPPDEPGAEMAREARVWKTYVRESDKSDKEMVDGRNNSLDVLLIFFRTVEVAQAALFSAISTAFVIESLGDLKPDPAESAAQTLLVMSQTLAAIANNRPVASPSPDALDPPAFSPSHTAVVVNILWFLSLSLSVAVSLVAMLAKEWCYKFMSSRSGPSYEQARRRQRKWNGMERWKMKKVLIYLPAMMHLALLLFALGLCLYLWDANKRVALPVIVVTVSATLVYTCATVLPAVDRFCPYSTPAIEILTDVKVVVTLVVKWIFECIDHRFKIIESSWDELQRGLPFPIPHAIGMVAIGTYCLLLAEPMDNFLTRTAAELSQGRGRLPRILAFIIALLLWACCVIIGAPCVLLVAFTIFLYFIVHQVCKSLAPGISVAIKASGHVVKFAILIIKSAIILIIKSTFLVVKAIVDLDDRLDDLYDGDARISMDTVTSQMLAWLISNCEDSRSVDTALQAIAGAQSDLPHEPLVECQILGHMLPRMEACINQNGVPPLAAKYCRSYGVLVSGFTFGVQGDRWLHSRNVPTAQAKDIHRHLMFCLDHINSAEQAGLSTDCNLLASVTTAIMPTCHWEQPYTLEGSQIEKVLKISTLLLRQQLERNTNLTPEPMLSALLESASHFLIGPWPRQGQPSPHSLLTILVARTFLLYRDTAPDIARSAAITLAATAFACNTYPGGEQPTPFHEDRETRAVDVLRHYQAHKPNKDRVRELFIFGFVRILPHLDLSDPETRLAATASYLNDFMQQEPEFYSSLDQTAIWTLPPSYSLRDQDYTPALQTLTQVATSGSPEDELRVVYTCLPLLFHRTREHDVPTLYMVALMALCQAKSRQLQDLCINITDRQPVPQDRGWGLGWADSATLLEQLCRTLINANTPVLPIATLHFEILMASVVMKPYPGLQERQNALQPLLAFRDRFPELKEASPLSLEKVSHSPENLGEDFTRSSMLHAMQCVVDFCEAGAQKVDDWRNKPDQLKDSYKPGITMIERLGGAEPGSSSEPARVEATSSEADISF